MADTQNSNTNSRRPGSSSPASEEAQQQGMSGARGAEAEQTEGVGKQPAQASGRRSAEHEQEPDERKGFTPSQAPSAQGDGDPGPEQIAEHQQGIRRQSGSHSAHGERSEEEARKGDRD
jgi:hypothetical protein